MKLRQEREIEVILFFCQYLNTIRGRWVVRNITNLCKLMKWDLFDQFQRKLVRQAGEQIPSLERQHTRTRSRGPRHTDLCFVIVIRSAVVSAAKRDRAALRCRERSRAQIYRTLHQNAKNDTYDIFYDGHNLAACHAERHHCQTERACFHSIEGDRGRTWRSPEEIDGNRWITRMPVYEIVLAWFTAANIWQRFFVSYQRNL